MTNLAKPRFGVRTLTEEQFLKDVSQHSLAVVRDAGLYRHLRLARPDTYTMGFEIITWPGYLCYCGDMGSYVFARVPDMLTFFRDRRADGALGISPHYWAEKVEAQDRDGIKEYSPELFRENVLSYLEESDTVSESLRAAVEENVLWHADQEHEAYRAVHEFDEQDFQFVDFFERDCRAYTLRFLWCCFALPWAIRLYDQHGAAKAA